MSIPVRARSSVSSSSVDDAFDKYIDEEEKKDAEDELLTFVEQQIQLMQKYSNLGNPQGMPGWFELNNALMDYNRVQTALIGLDVVAKQEAYHAEEEFKDQQAQWYMEAREILNPMSLTASKWASSSEIEAYVRVHHKDEYRQLSRNANAAQNKVAAIRRLLDAWNNQSLILNRLCKNVEAETISMGTGQNLGLNS